MYALNLRRDYRPTGGLMYELNLRRGYRPTGGLEEPFFRAERVASYKPPGLAGDDFGVGLAVPPRQIHYNTWLFSLKQLVNVPSWHTTVCLD